MKLRRRSYFSLLEMLVVISVLALVLTVVGANVSRMIEKQRFLSGVRNVVDRLQLAQDLMITLDTDVYVDIQITEGMDCWIRVEKPLISDLARTLNQHHHIAGVRSATFSDGRGGMQCDTIRLEFICGGSRMSRGRLDLCSHPLPSASSMSQQLVLSGYPRPIVLGQNQSEIDDEFKYEELYPAEILEEGKASIPTS